MPPCVASTSRVRAETSLLLSREARVAVDKLRRSPDLFAFLSFKEAFGPAHAFPRFTASDLEASLVQPSTRPLVVELLLRLAAAELPRVADEEEDERRRRTPPLQVPEDWEEDLAELLLVPADEAAEDSWLGEADPLGGSNFFDAGPAARLRLLMALAERRMRDGELADAVAADDDPPAGRTALGAAHWHGKPLGSDASGARWWALPGEPRVHCESKSGEWTVAAVTVAEVRALAARLAKPGDKANTALCSALLKSLLPPIEKAEAERAAAASRAAERAKREEEAAVARAVAAPRASLRTTTLEESAKRAAERAAEEARAAQRAAQEVAAALDARRDALRKLVPARYHSPEWEAELYATAELGERPAAALPPAPAPEGAAAIGRRVSVLWPREEAFFAGTVTAFSPSSGQHTIRYDDGDVERLKLAHEVVVWLDSF